MNILIKNTLILTMDENNNLLKNASIGIEDERIKYIGDVPENFKADKVIDGSGKIVMPHIPAALTI